MTQAAATVAELTRICKICGQTKPLSGFYVIRKEGRIRGYTYQCRSCISERARPHARRYNVPLPPTKICLKCNTEFPTTEGFPAYQKKVGGKTYYRTYCHACWKKYRAPYKDKYKKDKSELIRQAGRESYAKFKEARSAYLKDRYTKLKNICLDHYGHRCSCCGESEYHFLTFDHVNDDGAHQRREHGQGVMFFKWIIDSRFPSSIQILCLNCNAGRFRNGGICPHKSNDKPKV